MLLVTVSLYSPPLLCKGNGENMKYRITTSVRGYDRKPFIGSVRWQTTDLSLQEVRERLQQGYVICADFGFETDKVWWKGRYKDSFVQSPFIYLDIDGCQYEESEFMQKVINEFNGTLLKPTFAYATFSHKEEGKGNRYRLIYFFDKPLSIDSFNYVVKFYTEEVGKALDVELDHCSITCNQCCIGTRHSVVYGGVVHSLDEVMSHIDTTQPKDILKPCRKNSVEHFSLKEKVLFQGMQIGEWSSMVLEGKRLKTTNESDLGKKYNRSDLIRIPNRVWKMGNGTQRKKELYRIGKKLRYLNPSVSPLEVLAFICQWMQRNILSDMECISKSMLLQIANNVMEGDIDEYMDKRKSFMEARGLEETIYTDSKAKKMEKEEEDKAKVDEMFGLGGVDAAEVYLTINERRERFNKMKQAKICKNVIKETLGISEKTYQRYLKLMNN